MKKKKLINIRNKFYSTSQEETTIITSKNIKLSETNENEQIILDAFTKPVEINDDDNKVKPKKYIHNIYINMFDNKFNIFDSHVFKTIYMGYESFLKDHLIPTDNNRHQIYVYIIQGRKTPILLNPNLAKTLNDMIQKTYDYRKDYNQTMKLFSKFRLGNATDLLLNNLTNYKNLANFTQLNNNYDHIKAKLHSTFKDINTKERPFALFNFKFSEKRTYHVRIENVKEKDIFINTNYQNLIQTLQNDIALRNQILDKKKNIKLN